MGCEDVGDLLRLGHHAALTERLLVVSRTTTATHRHDRTVTWAEPLTAVSGASASIRLPPIASST